MQPSQTVKSPYRKRHSANVEEESQKERTHDESNWLVSYADMMTLLFGFFVLMYSFSKVDYDKFKVVRKELSTYFGGKQVEDETVGQIIQAVEKIKVESKIPVEQIQVSQKESTINVEIQSEILFGSGSAEITNQARRILYPIIEKIRASRGIGGVAVEGHTDDLPIRSPIFPTNWELSAARASRIVRLFEDMNFRSSMLRAEGFGSSQPIVPNYTKDGQIIATNLQKNRRVTIKLSLDSETNKLQEGLNTVPEKAKLTAEAGPSPEEVSRKTPLEATDSETAGDDRGEATQTLEQRLELAQRRISEANEAMAAQRKAELEQKAKEAMLKKVLDLEKKAKELESKIQK